MSPHDDSGERARALAGGYRVVEVPGAAAGMRLDRFLSGFFVDRSRSWMVRGIRDGLVKDPSGRALKGSSRVRHGDRLHLFLPGIAPTEPPPPFPEILHEDDRVVAVAKPAGLLVHPSGTRFAWALISMAKLRWPEHRVDLVHRLDRDTSGVIFLTKEREANVFLKEAIARGDCQKEYLALAKGQVPWDRKDVRAPIGFRGEIIRIQMGVRDDGLPAHTTFTVQERRPTLSLVRCELHTGRTHQIRVHLNHVGHPILGDRLYGVPEHVFLDTLDHGVTAATVAATGAPRHALHARRTVVPHPDGGELEVMAPLPPDMAAWWAAAGVDDGPGGAAG